MVQKNWDGHVNGYRRENFGNITVETVKISKKSQCTGAKRASVAKRASALA
jgi:hypothetical protein